MSGSSLPDARPFDVLTVGEPMVLFRALAPGPLHEAAQFAKHAAGAELNVAIGLARLGHHVGYLSRVGDDSFGRFLLDLLAREAIDASLVSVDPAHRTGFMLKSCEAEGADPVIEYHRRGSAASRLCSADLRPLHARRLHLTGILPALSRDCRELAFELARRARAAGAEVSFDPNLRPSLWASRDDMTSTINALAALCDLVLPGLAEGRALTGLEDPRDIALFYLERGARHVVVKLGADGALCADAAGMRHVPGVRVDRVVDTVGAGDGFAVGMLSGLLAGLPVAACVARGNAIGARVVQHAGDSDGLPTLAQWEEMAMRA